MSIVGYTLFMFGTEPHPLSPTAVTSKDYAYSLTQTAGGNPNSLFYHTFTLNGKNATYGFSLKSFGNPTLFYKYNAIHRGGQTMAISITELSKSQSFPYFGNVLIEPIAANQSITVRNHTYYSLDGGPSNQVVALGGGNRSVVGYSYTYYSPVTFTTDPNLSGQNIPYISSYNLTLNVEIRPIVEWGPYYAEGVPIWLNHTFEYTLAISKSI